MRIKALILLLFLIISCPPKNNVAKILNEEQWMGIYLKQEKIGYSFSRLQKVKDYYKLINRIKINLKMMEQPEQVISNFSGTLHSDYTLKDFEFSFNSRNRIFSANGQIDNGRLNIEVNSGGAIKKTQLNANFPIYPSLILGTVAIKKKLPINKEQMIKVFDATTLSLIDAKIKFLGKEQITIVDKDYNLYKVEIEMLGLKTIVWLDENGISKKEVSPPGMVMIEETRDQALLQEESLGKIDILSLFSITVDTLISNPRAVKYLKVKFTDANLSDLIIADETQRIIQNQPLILEITTPERIPSNLTLPITEYRELLKPSLYVQSDDPAIKKTINKIIGQETNAVKITENIMKWVFTNIQKRATASLPSALDVLKNLEGDCNEHAVLFTALSRAAGIPCQICVGLVYVDGKFYYHAWNKVYLRKWIMVDPTFGQFPADATHIKLSEGELEEQAKVLNIVGKAKIKILEYH
ncbi:MAG: transglutaminase domain-containing protein [candidate division WOR-3 bacterium]|nr:transglutaminase domain-containing protein [candidate division WOR-3 bacterium]